MHAGAVENEVVMIQNCPVAVFTNDEITNVESNVEGHRSPNIPVDHFDHSEEILTIIGLSDVISTDIPLSLSPANSTNQNNQCIFNIDDCPPLLSLFDGFEIYLRSLSGGSKTTSKDCRQHVTKIIDKIEDDIQCLSVENVENAYFMDQFELCNGVPDENGSLVSEPEPTQAWLNDSLT